MADKPNPEPRFPLFDHALDAPSAFTPEALIEAVRIERNLPSEPAPEICILEFDGDLTDWLVATGRCQRWKPWACFHTAMELVEAGGETCGIIARTIGGPYAVLVAEQLAASGAKVILGLTSAGRVSPELEIPSLVIPDRAIRDEGTSHHYLPPDETVRADARITAALQHELATLSLPVVTGAVWTTDAPYRETSQQLDRHGAAGVLAVEMQAASLFAFAAARRVHCGLVAHVTNGMNHSPEDQFDKGSHHVGLEILSALCRSGRRILGNR